MSNLIDEYFKRDLTEAEEKQLGDLLASSPEEAERLSKGLSDMYAKSDLPEPVWPGGTMPFGKSKWWILKPLAPLMMILAFTGFAAYKWMANMHASPLIQEPIVAPMPIQQGKAPSKKLHALSKAVLPALKGVSKPYHAAVPLPTRAADLSMPQLPSNPIAATAPAAPQGHVYQQMSVVLDQAAPGLVTVKVKDNLNTEVRTLYAGILPEGKKTFTWDGKTELGSVAPAGTYFIEVKSGQNVMKQKVNVEGDGTP